MSLGRNRETAYVDAGRLAFLCLSWRGIGLLDLGTIRGCAVSEAISCVASSISVSSISGKVSSLPYTPSFVFSMPASGYIV